MFKLLLIWRYFLHKRVVLLAVLAVTLVMLLVLGVCRHFIDVGKSLVRASYPFSSFSSVLSFRSGVLSTTTVRATRSPMR